MNKIVAALLLLTFLAGCAPSVTGTAPLNPLEVPNDEPVEVIRGSSIYLGLEYPLDAFELTPASLSGRFWIPAGANSQSANLVQEFVLEDVIVPLGWSLELERIRAFNSEDVRYGQGTGEFSYRIDAVLLLRVPSDANLGVSELRASLVHRSGARQELSLPVRVRAPQAN